MVRQLKPHTGVTDGVGSPDALAEHLQDSRGRGPTSHGGGKKHSERLLESNPSGSRNDTIGADLRNTVFGNRLAAFILARCVVNHKKPVLRGYLKSGSTGDDSRLAFI